MEMTRNEAIAALEALPAGSLVTYGFDARKIPVEDAIADYRNMDDYEGEDYSFTVWEGPVDLAELVELLLELDPARPVKLREEYGEPASWQTAGEALAGAVSLLEQVEADGDDVEAFTYDISL